MIHKLFDVAHPIAWVDNNGNHPVPFTIIDDRGLNSWKASKPGLQKRFETYVNELKALGRNPLCVWLPHCLIGSPGSNVVESLFEAFSNWCLSKRLTINWVAKGSNPLTEHYSAVVADVPDSNDPGTQLNINLIQLTETADTILLAGEAGSHCLKWTVTDIANNFGSESSIKKFVLLTDATSPVPGFESHYEQFVNELSVRGMQTATTTDWMS